MAASGDIPPTEAKMRALADLLLALRTKVTELGFLARQVRDNREHAAAVEQAVREARHHAHH